MTNGPKAVSIPKKIKINTREFCLAINYPFFYRCKSTKNVACTSLVCHTLWHKKTFYNNMRGTGFPKHAEDTELRGLCKALEFCVPLKPILLVSYQ